MMKRYNMELKDLKLFFRTKEKFDQVWRFLYGARPDERKRLLHEPPVFEYSTFAFF